MIEFAEVTRLIAVIIGMAVGVLQLYLLSVLTVTLLKGQTPRHMALIVLGKLALYAAALLGTAFVRPDRLVHMGAGLAAGLVVAGICQFVRQRWTEKHAIHRPSPAGDLAKGDDESR